VMVMTVSSMKPVELIGSPPGSLGPVVQPEASTQAARRMDATAFLQDVFRIK